MNILCCKTMKLSETALIEGFDESCNVKKTFHREANPSHTPVNHNSVSTMNRTSRLGLWTKVWIEWGDSFESNDEAELLGPRDCCKMESLYCHRHTSLAETLLCLYSLRHRSFRSYSTELTRPKMQRKALRG